MPATHRKQPRVKEKEIRIREIQSAARKIFFKKGYRNSTIDKIAQLAGISKGAVYLHFKNKEDLYISLMHSVGEGLRESLRKFEAEVERGQYANHAEVIKGFLHLLFRNYQSDPDGLRILQAFQQGNIFKDVSKKTLRNVQQIGRDNFAIMRRILQRVTQMGLIRNVDPIQVSDILWGLFTGIVHLEERKLKVTQKDHIQTTLEYAFSILADALNPTQNYLISTFVEDKINFISKKEAKLPIPQP